MLLCGAVSPIFASPTFAINLREFKRDLQVGDATKINADFAEIIASKSPELIMKSRTAMLQQLPESKARTAMLQQCLEVASHLEPQNREQALMVASAQFITAEQLADGEYKRKLLDSASKLGHDKAPEQLAMLIASEQPEKADDLLRLSVTRGNYMAAVTYAKLQKNPQKIKQLRLILEKLARNGDKRAVRALQQMR